jgi:hypothetical protein
MSNRAEQWSLHVRRATPETAPPRKTADRFGLICLVLLALLGISVSLIFAANGWVVPELMIGP